MRKLRRLHPTGPAQLPAIAVLRLQLAGWNLLPAENQLDFHIVLAARVEPRQGAQLAISLVSGQEVHILFQSERPQLDARPRLLVPGLIAHHRAKAQLGPLTLEQYMDF